MSGKLALGLDRYKHQTHARGDHPQAQDGYGLFDLAQEAQEFLMAVARLALRPHYSDGHVKGRKQGGGAVWM